MYCSGLTEVTLSSSITSIGSSAFSMCKNLKSVNIPSSVTSIQSQAFYYCNSLKSITIPSSVNFIGRQAFILCSELSSIYALNTTPINLISSEGVFSEVNKTTCTLYVPSGTKTLYASANQWKDFTNIVEMAEFKLSATSATIATAGGTATVNLTTGLSWSASSDQTWLTINAASGTGNQTFTLTATANSSVAIRLATVTIATAGIPSQTIIVTQAGAPKTLAATPGGLATALTAAELNGIANLILTGTIDARDFKTMRDNMPLLSSVDLSGVTVAAYTGTEGTSGTNNITYPANTVPDYAYFNSSTNLGKTSLTSIVLPSSVTSIGNNAFLYCSGLTSINIPSLVTSVGSQAFALCTAFITVDASNSNYSSLDGVLFNKMKTTLIQCPTSKTGTYAIPSSVISTGSNAFSSCTLLTAITIPSSVTSIGSYTFQNCTGLIAFTIPSSVTSIGSGAFTSCKGLTTVTIPSSVTSIGSYAFQVCSGLISIYVNSGTPVNLNSVSGVFNSVNKSTCKLYVPFGSSALYAVANQWKDFANIVEMAEFKLSATTATIATSGGTATSNLTTALAWSASTDQAWLTVTPASGTGNQTFTCTAGANASFSNRVAIVSFSATGLPSQTIVIIQAGSPKTLNVTAGGLATALTANELNSISTLILTGTIDARDFKTMRDNMPLLSVVDLSGVTIVAYNGLDGTSPWGNNNYPENGIPEAAFRNINGQGNTTLTSIILPPSTTSIGQQAFISCIGLTTFTIPSLVSSIGSSAFNGCTGLTSVTIPSSLSSIGSGAFNGCTGLTSVTIPSSLSSIGSGIFAGCTGLTTVTIPSSVTSIGLLAFASCGGLTSVNIPSSVTSIGDAAFLACSGLTSVNIPSSVTSIGSSAFNTCSGLTSIYSLGTIPVNLSSSINVFNNVNKTTCTLYVPYGTKVLYAAANQWKDFTSILEMAEFKLSATAATIAATGGTASVNLTTGLAWTASSDQTWLNVNSSSGTGNQTFNLTATANSSLAARIGTVTVSTTGVPSQTVVITQAGAPKTLAVTAGGLATALTAAELGTVSNLVLTGTIDARDFKTMRDNMPMLSMMDLSGVTVAAYSGTEGTCPSSWGSYSYLANGVPDYAFYEPYFGSSKTSLISFVLPPTVTSVGNSAFIGCTGLTFINIPSSITSILSQAFYRCTAPFTVDAANPNFSAIDGVLFNKLQTTLIQCPVSKTGTYNIPASVVSIGSYAFGYCNGLSSVVIPTSVNTIGYNAFNYCSGLTSVNIPSSVTSIGSFALGYCSSLTTVAIPSSVTSIEYGTFYYCTGLTSVTIPSTVTSIGSQAFYQCSKLAAIYALEPFPVNLINSASVFMNVNKATCTLYVPYGAKAVYTAANQWKDFTNIVELDFSLSATRFNFAAGGGTTNVTITSAVAWTVNSDQNWLTASPASGTGNNTLVLTATANPSTTIRTAMVTVTTTGSFTQTILVTQAASPKIINITAGGLAAALTTEEKNSLTTLTLTGTMDARDFRILRDAMPLLATLDISGVTVAAYSGNEGTADANNYVYPANGIPDYAFCVPVTFSGKLTLTSITMPPSITSIGQRAFSFCSSLPALNITSSVVSIGAQAFCSSSATITVDANNPNYSALDGVLFNKDKTRLFHCPTSKTGGYVVPTSVNFIENRAFNFCRLLTSLTIPSSVTTIGDYDFYYCSGLTSVNIPASVTSIGKYAFYVCSSLISVTIPSGVPAINEYTFYGCSGLTSIVIPSSVISVADYAFALCSNLTSIDIPASVTSLGKYAFYNCIKLTSVAIPNGVAAINDWTFSFCSSLTSVAIPSSVTSIGGYAFYGCSGLTSIKTYRTSPLNLSPSPNVFYNVNKTTCTLYVPFGTSGLYRAANQWQDFVNIVEMPDFKLSAATANIATGSGSTATVELTSNIAWTASSDQTWLAMSPTSGTGNKTLTFTAEANTAATTRTATVTLSATGVTSLTVTVTQAAKIITHFTPVWTGNGFDQMNINIYSAKMDGVEMEAGDEVGIFDGAICVGVGKLTGAITQQSTLDIVVSKNDGSGNGYNAGNTISFKLYDASNTLEMSNVPAVYSNADPSWGTDGNFAIGVTSFAALTGATKVNQDIALNLGWNIISAYVIPANLDLKAIFQTLIDASSLKKVMDESGKTIENFGAFGGWKNNIGNLNSAKGYKVNVTTASTLSLEGLPVTLPLTINLALGWNIISYPCPTAQDAKALVQPLIDGGQLKKVMDESGKTIENFGAFGGWKNNIGNFLPGKGYKVNVTAACTLSVAAPLNKSAVIVPDVLASSHFSKVFTGNGTDHFNVHLVDLASSGLKAGDQIGIFDGKYCVGAATIGMDQLISGNISIPASFNDEVSGKVNGFTVGHPVTLQLYRENQTYPLTPSKVGGSESFEKNGSLFLKVTASDLPAAKISTGADQVKCYPNPFADQLTIEIRLTEPKKLEVSIYDLNGKLVRSLFNGEAGTSETMVWDGTNGNGAKMGSGTYLLKANGMIEKVALKK